LKCQEKQGYKVGDIRGGISVSLAWDTFREALRSQLFVIIPGYGGIWMLGILGLYFGRKQLQNHLAERQQAEASLEEKHRQLQQAFDEITTLRGIVPICSYCKKIRDDKGYWNQVEQYEHTEAKFSHGICPTCFEREMNELKS